MKLRLHLLPALALTVLGLTSQAFAQAPTAQLVYIGGFGAKLGEPAPTLVSTKWIKGSPVTFQPGKVTVLTFFASWCAPCRETFPEVAALARRFKGKVNFAGISVWERPEDVKTGAYVDKIRGFVRTLGSQMPFSVAVDDDQNTNAIHWLGQFGPDIPKAFIIDQTGRVAWSGHPLADLEDVLDRVVEGKYDVKKEVQRQHWRWAAESKMRDVVVPVQKALVIRSPKETVAAIDEAIAKNPEMEQAFGTVKFQMLSKYDEKAAYSYALGLSKGVCKDNANALNMIAWTIVDDKSELKNPDYKAAIDIARRADELANHGDGYILDTLAYALYKSGEKSKALDLQIKAVALAEKMENGNPRILEEMRTRLALFRKQQP